MATSTPSSTAGEYRSRVLTGDLPEGFLQLDENRTTPGHAAQQHAVYQPSVAMHTIKRLSVTIIQAKLAKNYGLARMDPYCRLRVGHHVFETPTASNGSINPTWNKTVTCPLINATNTVYVEIFDECSFSTDAQIAWGLIKITNEVLKGETVDDWYPLTGKQGEQKEGMINIVLSCMEVTEPVPATPVMIFPQAYTVRPQMYYPPMAYGMPQQMPPRPMAQQPRPVAQQPVQINPDDVKNIKDMFPDLDEEVIRSVLEASGGNVDAAINQLLSMNEN